MFEKILFSTTAQPNNDNAAKVAFDLASRNGAQLSLLHVYGLPSRGFSQSVQDLKTGEENNAGEDYQAWVEDELKHIYGGLMANMQGGTAKLETAVGVPATEILRYARQENVDIIVMGAHSREDTDSSSARVRVIIGNTMQKVAKASRCPVLIVNRPCNTCWRMFSNIIFCTDFSKPADAAFQFAFNTAKEVGAKLYLFHVVDISNPVEGMLSSQDDIEARVAKAQKLMEEKYVPRMTSYDNYQIDILEGTPYVEILKYAREKQADLIVMAHHTKNFEDENADIGTTVEQVVLRSACPVASVNRPDKVELSV